MKIDLAALKRDKKSQVDLNFAVNLDTIDYYGDQIKLPSAIEVTGKLYVIDERMYLNCRFEAELIMNCSRCLKPTTYRLSEKINAELVREDFEEEEAQDLDDLIYYQNETIDLKEVIKESILMNVPFQMLCAEDCKGLCAHCGKDLNVEQCQCAIEDGENEEVSDPRLAKLKELLKDN
ncbi:YceD family protein [Alkaliphilus crotonatoxidans]